MPITIHQGDALTVLQSLAADSVHCVVTSPPYFGARDYGTGSWVGGDPACDHRPGSERRVGRTRLQGGTATTGHQAEGYRSICPKCGAQRDDLQIGLEDSVEKYVDRLVAVFEEVRRVLRPDGTVWLNLADNYAGSSTGGFRPGAGRADGVVDERRQRNRNGNGCPPGYKVKDLLGIPWRVTLALQEAGWWLRADIIWAKTAPMPESVRDRPTRSHEYIFLRTPIDRYYYDQEAASEPAKTQAGRRNWRDVWTIGPEPFLGEHYAAFPTEIPRRAILAGTSAIGCCAGCGAPWERDAQGDWHASCYAPAPVVPCTVLDPFCGSGTTLAVAAELKRSAIGIDLSPAYAAMARSRVEKVQPRLDLL